MHHVLSSKVKKCNIDAVKNFHLIIAECYMLTVDDPIDFVSHANETFIDWLIDWFTIVNLGNDDGFTTGVNVSATKAGKFSRSWSSAGKLFSVYIIIPLIKTLFYGIWSYCVNSACKGFPRMVCLAHDREWYKKY